MTMTKLLKRVEIERRRHAIEQISNLKNIKLNK